MASVHHLEFGNFWNFLTFPSPGSKFASTYLISSYSDDSRLRYGDITIFKMAAVRNVGFIVTLSYCTGRQFNTLDIMLNFDMHRFHTFWYTSTIMFHHFSLKLPIICPNFHIFLKKYGKILNLNVPTPKGTSVRETTCFELQMLNIFLSLWSVHETKKNCLIVWLIDCVLVRKKLKFPYLPSQNGLTEFCQILHDNSTRQHNDIS